MLENDLKIRNQFASKIINKVKKINDDIKLLSKVDNQLLKNINKKGGNIENFHINKIGGSPPSLDNERQIKFVNNQLRFKQLVELKDKLTQLKKDNDANNSKNSTTAAANSESIDQLKEIIIRLEVFIKAFDTLNDMLSEFEVPELDKIDFKELDKIDTKQIKKLDELIPSELPILNPSDITKATTAVEALKIEYKELVQKQIPKYTFDQTSGANDYTKDVIWNNNDLISNVGGAYYEILDKLLVDPILKYTFSKDKKDFIHRQLNITAPDITNSNIKPIHDAYTYLNEQKESKEAQENKKRTAQQILKDPSKSADHAAANADIGAANAEINKIDLLIPMAQKNYDKMIGKSADADIDTKNTKILADAKTTITDNEEALKILTSTGGNIPNAKTAAGANANVLAILNALTPGANDMDNITNLTAMITNLKNELNTATAIDALRKAIRDYPTDDNNNIITKFDPSISADARKIITDAIAAATPGDLDPRNVLDNLKSKSTITMVGGGRSSRRNSSRTSRHNSSRTSRHDSSSTSRHSGW